MQRYEESIQDCGAALELDNSCLAAMVQRGKCYMELQEWDKAVSPTVKGTVSRDIFCSGFFLNQLILVLLEMSWGCFDF